MPRCAATEQTMGGLVRYFILFVYRLQTRAVAIAGITHDLNEASMSRVARNLGTGPVRCRERLGGTLNSRGLRSGSHRRKATARGQRLAPRRCRGAFVPGSLDCGQSLG